MGKSKANNRKRTRSTSSHKAANKKKHGNSAPKKPSKGAVTRARGATTTTAKSSSGASSSRRCTTVQTEEEELAAFERDGIMVVDSSDDEGTDREKEVGSGTEDEEEPMVLDEDEELKMMMAKWDSPIYAFFEPVPEIEYVDDRHSHVFTCSARKCGTRIRRFLDSKDRSSTRNLRRHARSCWGEEAVDTACEAVDIEEAREKVIGALLRDGSITAAFKRKKGDGKIMYSHRPHTCAETRTEIVRWVAESQRPFNIVRDRGFQCLMKTGRPGYFIPSPKTVSHDAKTIFARTHRQIAKMLQEYDGDLHFATDAWTSPNHRAFVAVTVHLEVEGNPLALLLDLVEVPRSHSGVNLAAEFATILKEFDIADKILTVTCDNASNNKTMIEKLVDLLPDFPGEVNHVRCFAHVLNLVAKSLIKQFDAEAEHEQAEVGADEQELLELTRDLEDEERTTLAEEAVANAGAEGENTADNTDDEVDAMAEMSDEEREKFARDVRPVKLVMAKICKISFKIIHSTTLLLPAWYASCAAEGLPEKLLPRDVRTRWNSTFDMLDGALKARVVVDKMTGEKAHGLRAYELSEDEWEIARQLRHVLKVFKDATLFFSRGTPNLATVIPAMDHIDQVLTTASLNEDEYDDAIRVACGLAKTTLNAYYSLTDASSAYRIAMILHPRHKTEYFHKLRWSESWRRTAIKLVTDEYRSSYENRVPKDNASSAKDTGSAGATGVGPGRAKGKAKATVEDDEKNIFDTLDTLTSKVPDVRDELKRYLSTDVEPVSDALQWWNDRRATFPNLSRMALDYLTIPATSIEVERIFSRGRLLLTHVRNRLSAQTCHALLCLGNWSLLGLIKAEDEKAVARLDELEGDESDYEMEDGWDAINV
ncbi:hypothetical protein GSI_00250 [Ganoderma sinense ZZ0214-1]|uniref:HAT C-terminal dimerisation domain-containing protein n=1 Tax=Ganoderma sinense ZZ0214-1 TaxID=1077348 RepID=A0A2G8SS00_9APHY|nr:hypothetical protein GSI_00250 [Ganoderma sinense ZZ0214-1]